MAQIEVGNLKSLHEALCVAQSALGRDIPDTLSEYKKTYTNRIQEVLDQIEILRPTGPDGNHGTRHTEHCGCEDNPYLDLLNSWRVISFAPRYEVSGRGLVRISEYSSPEERELTRLTTIVIGDVATYDLSAIDASGHQVFYEASAKELIDHAFPELGEKAK